MKRILLFLIIALFWQSCIEEEAIRPLETKTESFAHFSESYTILIYVSNNNMQFDTGYYGVIAPREIIIDEVHPFKYDYITIRADKDSLYITSKDYVEYTTFKEQLSTW